MSVGARHYDLRMAIESDLKIFISWSGDLAREVTKVLRAWLPKMFDHIDPWASDVDIDAGTRSMDVIQERLNDSAFGIIVVTTENMNKPWLNFEAGALSRTLGANPSRVIPLLVNFDDLYQLQGPISQYHATKLGKDGVLRVCQSMASVIGLNPAVIGSRFEWAWPALEAAIADAQSNVDAQPDPPVVDEKDMLSNLFQAVRSLDRKINSLQAVDLSSPPIKMVRQIRRRPSQDSTNRWDDALEVINAQEIIKNYVSANYRPVRLVRPMDWKGQKVLGIVFQDGEGMTGGANDFNELMDYARNNWPFPVAVVSDKSLEDGLATPL